MQPRTIDSLPLPVAMWHVSQRGYDFIKSFEELHLHAYDDGAGNPTIGWGHKLNGEHLTVISEGQAMALFKLDCMKALAVLRTELTHPMWQCEVDALVSLVFNIGGMAFTTSHLRKALEARDWAAVQHEWLRWDHAEKKRLKGLTRRRKAELAMFGEVPF